MPKCHWEKDSTVPGGRFWLPGCMGGIYGKNWCTCPTQPTIRQRIGWLLDDMEYKDLLTAMRAIKGIHDAKA